MTPREAEAMAFIKASAMMEESQRNSEDVALRSQALRFNQLFWTILQADIMDPNNALPSDIKGNIMSLSIFVDKQTSKALRSVDPADLDILISINRNLAAGLKDQQPAVDPTPPPHTPLGATSV
ncbi:flagellar biosynthesis regulator FlaF [Roseospira marina]|nr:flagellar biosynthesis regulator FlaF [Roseospira marina]MBB5086907.1 flagellar protein FlaF [Roseospira marina]